MPADTGRSDLRTQEGERRAYAQGGTRLSKLEWAYALPLCRDLAGAGAGASSGDRWAKLREEWGKIEDSGEWEGGWKDPLGVRGRNRKQAEERKVTEVWGQGWRMKHCREEKKQRVQLKVKACLAENGGWELQGKILCWLITNWKYLELNCLWMESLKFPQDTWMIRQFGDYFLYGQHGPVRPSGAPLVASVLQRYPQAAI